ncbi:MAG: hypothetical protein ACM30G_11285 [Micromonosporaceae bacterium]
MRSKGKMVAWGVTVAAAAALVITSTVHAGFGSGSAVVATPRPTATSLSSVQLRSVLVPLSQQPASQSVGPITLKQAANSFPLPAGEVYSPWSCLLYIYNVIGSFNGLDGWIQYGTRVATGKKFIQYVVDIPSGANVGAIAASAATCPTGTITLQGTVTGGITLTNSQAPQFAGAQSYALNTRIQFNETPGSPGATILNQYLGQVFSGPSFDVQTYTDVTDFVGVGNTLMVVEEFDQETADVIAGGMVENLNKVIVDHPTE